MTDTDDIEFLRRFAFEQSEAAFAELVRRRIDFVHAIALRQVGGDAHLAAEVCQSVFIALAHKAGTLARRPVLVSWFYTSTRLAAAQALRTRSRWINRQQEAYAMQQQAPDPIADSDWRALRPVIDDAMHDLGEADRIAVLLRYFDGKALAQVGRSLNLSEDAARKRVDRALEKLRDRLARRGITSTAAALGAILGQQHVVAAPAGLAATVSGISMSSVATGGSALAIPLLMSTTTKITIGAVCAAVIAGSGAYFVAMQQSGAALSAERAQLDARSREIASERQENLRLKDEYRKLASSRTDSGSVGAPDAGPSATSTPDTASPSDTSVASTIAALVKSGAIQPSVMNRIPFLGKDRQLSDAFASFFSVNPAERESLQKAVDDARQQLGLIGAASATVQREADGSVVISVPAFGGGAEIKERMLSSFLQVLGTERNDLFQTLAVAQINTTLSQYGGAQQTITLRHNPNPPDKAHSFQVQDRRTWSSDGGSHNNESEGYPVSDFAILEASFGPLAKLIPPDF